MPPPATPPGGVNSLRSGHGLTRDRCSGGVGGRAWCFHHDRTRRSDPVLRRCLRRGGQRPVVRPCGDQRQGLVESARVLAPSPWLPSRKGTAKRRQLGGALVV